MDRFSTISEDLSGPGRFLYEGVISFWNFTGC